MKRKKKGDLGSLDSLLDTMTSVVGILIIILVVLQLGAKQAIQRIQSDPNSSPALKEASEQLAKKEKEHETLYKDRLRLNEEKAKLVEKIGGNPTAALKEEMLKKIAALQPKPSNPQLAKELATLKAQNTQLTATSKSLEEKVAEIEKKLAAMPKVPPKPANKNLRLPDPKEPVPGSVGHRIICTGGRVLPIHFTNWHNRVKAALTKSGLKKNQAGEFMDSKALVAYFKKSPIGDALFKVETVHQDKGKLLYYRFIPHKGKGDLPENLSKAQSNFQGFLSKLDPKKSYVLFTVQPDSFDAYLEARKLLDAKGIPAGWVPSAPQPFVWQHHFHTLTNGRSKLPKPKPSTQPSAARAILD